MQILEPLSLNLARGRAERWSKLVAQWQEHAHESPPIAEGSLVRATGLTLEAAGCAAPIGTRCIAASSPS